jgi:hypothetical protein
MFIALSLRIRQKKMPERNGQVNGPVTESRHFRGTDRRSVNRSPFGEGRSFSHDLKSELVSDAAQSVLNGRPVH